VKRIVGVYVNYQLFHINLNIEELLN
jgi:hypothetical protein